MGWGGIGHADKRRVENEHYLEQQKRVVSNHRIPTLMVPHSVSQYIIPFEVFFPTAIQLPQEGATQRLLLVQSMHLPNRLLSSRLGGVLYTYLEVRVLRGSHRRRL